MTRPVAAAGPACNASSSWNVLLPGAAHMSSTYTQAASRTCHAVAVRCMCCEQDHVVTKRRVTEQNMARHVAVVQCVR